MKTALWYAPGRATDIDQICTENEKNQHLGLYSFFRFSEKVLFWEWMKFIDEVLTHNVYNKINWNWKVSKNVQSVVLRFECIQL